MSQLSARAIAVCRTLSRAISLSLGGVGLIVLIGWWLDVALLKSLLSGWAAMKPNTAAGLLLAAAALLPMSEVTGLAIRPWRWWVRSLAGMVALLGALTFIQHLISADFGIDGLLIKEAYDITATATGRMSPLAAVAFLILGIALALLTCGTRPVCAWVAQIGALAAAFGAFLAIVGYLYGRETLGLAPFFTSTALHTALALLALSIGVACAQPAGGLMALFNADSAGGAVLRRLLLPVVLLPVVLNWLEREGERQRFYPIGFGWMLDAAVTVLLVGLLVWIVARIVHEKDIARKLAEEELRKSEERYRQLVEMSPNAIIVKDARRIEFANSAARRLVGATQSDEVLGRSPFAFVHPTSRAVFEKDFCRVLRDGTSLPPTEQRVVRLDGTEVDIEFSASAVDYHGQRFAQVVASDITARKRATQALRESEERFRLIAETVTEVFWMADVQLERTVYVSPAYERVWGLTCASLYANPRSFLDAVHPDDRARVLAKLEADKQGLPFTHEYRVVRPDGTIRWVLDRGYPVRPEGGEVLHYVGVAQDITERKQAEEELRATVERLQVVARVTGDAVWDWDMIADTTWWSDAFVDKFGYARGILPSYAAWLEHVHPEDRDRATAEFNAAVARKAPAWSSEYRFRLGDGSYGIILDRVYSLSDAAGKPVRMIGSMVEITELRRMEEQARLLAKAVESTSDLISITSLDDRFIFANQAFLDAYGYTAEEVIGQSPALLAPVGANLAARIRPQVLAGGWSGELTNLRKNGAEFPIYLNASPVRDAQGKVIALMGVAKDITEQKRAEGQIRYQAWLLDQVRNAVIATDTEGRITHWNHHATTLYQWTAAEAVGRLLMDLLIPDPEWERASALVEEIKHAGSWEGEFLVQRKDGHRFPVFVADALLRDDHGEIIGIVGVSFDLTERKEAEVLLQSSEARFRATFEQAAMGMTITTPDGRFLRVNEKFCLITGYPIGELLDLTFQEITHPDDLAQHLEMIRRLVVGEHPSETIEKRYTRKDGAPVWCELTTSLVRRNDGEPEYLITLVEDITRRRTLEAQFRQAQKMEAVGQLAGGVAHDFNNMLTAIQGHVSLLDMAATLPAPARESLQEIMGAARRAASLTRQLLLFSRREVMQPTRLNVNDTVTSIAKMLQRLIGEDVRMRLHLHPRVLAVHADSGMIDQVLMNLAVNSRDAMPRGGDLIIETAEKEVGPETAELNPEAPAGRYACLSVSDTGSGIPPDILPRVFEPFFTTKEVGKGTGLGLATVFGIVKQHRGWVKVYSEVGRGTTFRVFLPLVSASDLPAQVSEAPAAPPRGRGETVLVVEDDDSVRKLTILMLERAGYRVLATANGEDALREWERHAGRVDLLLTDLVMPGNMTGRELAVELQLRKPGLAVIFVSGYSAEIAGRDLTMGDRQTFLQKPFETAQLLRTIHQFMSTRDQP